MISRLFLKGGKSVSVGLLTCAQIGKGGREDFSAPVALFHPLSFGLVSLRREKEGRKEGGIIPFPPLLLLLHHPNSFSLRGIRPLETQTVFEV